MKSLKKLIRDGRLRTHEKVSAWLKPKVGAVGTKLRLAGRIRLANRWARHHPRRTFAYVTTVLVLALASNIAFEVMAGNKRVAGPDMGVIANMDPVLDGFRTIQANKDMQKNTILELTQRGQTLRHELDSLIALPVKKHADSIAIIARYGQLERIVKSLKNNDK